MLSADGKRIVTGSDDKTVRVWNLEDDDLGASAIVLRGHHGAVTAVELSADGRRLVTSSRDGTVRVWLLRIEDLLAVARRLAGRPLTDEEREMYDIKE